MTGDQMYVNRSYLVERHERGIETYVLQCKVVNMTDRCIEVKWKNGTTEWLYKTIFDGSSHIIIEELPPIAQ